MEELGKEVEKKKSQAAEQVQNNWVSLLKCCCFLNDYFFNIHYRPDTMLDSGDTDIVTGFNKSVDTIF